MADAFTQVIHLIVVADHKDHEIGDESFEKIMTKFKGNFLKMKDTKV